MHFIVTIKNGILIKSEICFIQSISWHAALPPYLDHVLVDDSLDESLGFSNLLDFG